MCVSTVTFTDKRLQDEADAETERGAERQDSDARQMLSKARVSLAGEYYAFKHYMGLTRNVFTAKGLHISLKTALTSWWNKS